MGRYCRSALSKMLPFSPDVLNQDLKRLLLQCELFYAQLQRKYMTRSGKRGNMVHVHKSDKTRLGCIALFQHWRVVCSKGTLTGDTSGPT